MAIVNLGAIKFNWKGAYNSSTTYAVDDVVSSGGNSYVCIQAHSNQAVGNATAYWNIMSSAGTNGSNGSNGTDLTSTLTTQGDILYRDGSGLQRLAKGTAGQVLQMNSGATAPEYATASGGITEADMWRLTTAQSGGTNADITANLERTDDATFAKIGTGMTESSGIFTFPSTGLYEVSLNPYIYSYSDSNSYLYGYVSSNSGSSYTNVIAVNIGSSAGSISVMGIQSTFVNVTNASTFRVKFGTESMGSNSFVRGETDRNMTTFKFIRLGDSQ